MTIYFHETLDPVRQPGAHTRFLRELGEIVNTEGNAKGSVGSECVALWAPVFVTGTWPQIIGFWEMPTGWAGFADHFDNNPSLFHEPLDRWYGERSGGFDRILVPTDYTRTLSELKESGVRAPVVLQQTITLSPGGAEEYLELFRDASKAISDTEIFTPFGAYEVAFRNGTEVMLHWAFPDVATVAAAESNSAQHPELRSWIEKSRSLEVNHTGIVLRPTWWSPLC